MSGTALQDAEFLPFKLDLAQRRVLLLKLSAKQRADATFLDERAIPSMPKGVWVPLSAAQDEGLRCPSPRMAWIFHIGHCGSTLLSRLIHSWPRIQVLREPLPLRELAAGSFDCGAGSHDKTATLVDAFSRLWARPLHDAEGTLVKATSSCNDLILPMLSARAMDRVILLSMPLRGYLATLLKSQASVGDVMAAADGRWAFLRRALPTIRTMPAPHFAGEICAMGWLAERIRFDAITQASEQAMEIDFEQLLGDPRAVLARVATHLRLSTAYLDNAMTSPWWHRYAKAEDLPYSVDDRAHDQQLARIRFADEIARGVAWVGAICPLHSA